jgi:hypothetical protein
MSVITLNEQFASAPTFGARDPVRELKLVKGRQFEIVDGSSRPVTVTYEGFLSPADLKAAGLRRGDYRKHNHVYSSADGALHAFDNPIDTYRFKLYKRGQSPTRSPPASPRPSDSSSSGEDLSSLSPYELAVRRRIEENKRRLAEIMAQRVDEN